MDHDFADSSVVRSQEWKRTADSGEIDPGIDNRLMDGDEPQDDGGLAVHSLSGKERNHLFLNSTAGKDFADVSALSGMDSPSDARGFALLDYDRDGWQDVAVVNANQPLTQLFHNDIAQLPGAESGMIAVRFIGGNTTATTSDLSNRDGYGAMVEAVLEDGVTLKREHRCGEGYAAQNSATMLIGIGGRDRVERLKISWPSGKKTELEDIKEGMLVTAYEDRANAPFTQKAYRVKTKANRIVKANNPTFPFAKTSSGDNLQIYTTTATWCPSCLSHLPALAALKETGVALYGVPIDPEDDDDKLAQYVAEKSPPYQMMAEIGAADRSKIDAFLANELQIQNPGLPSSVITDGDGKVLEVMQGVPTLSQIRKWTAARRP